MDQAALSILTKAEYLASLKNGRNVHRVNSLLTQIYLLCSVNRFSEARQLLDELYFFLNHKQGVMLEEKWVKTGGRQLRTAPSGAKNNFALAHKN